MMIRALIVFVLLSTSAQAATYYISPSGSNANDGLTTSTPWLTFAYALDVARASCGDTLNLMDGVYGVGTSTGTVSLSSRVCTLGDDLTIRALNQRKARISASGNGWGVQLLSSSHIIIDGLVINSTDATGLGNVAGAPFSTDLSSFITVRNSVLYNPNKYHNRSPLLMYRTTDSLVEDVELYEYHRHGFNLNQSRRIVVRRGYCNPRAGAIVGGYDAANQQVGTADACVAFYPCEDCVAENIMVDGEQSRSYLNEINANGIGGVASTNNKVLGSICYKCGGHNQIGLYWNSRVVGTLGSATDALAENVVIHDHLGTGSATRMVSVAGTTTMRNVTFTSANAAPYGFELVDTVSGNATTTVAIVNSIAQGFSTRGYYQFGNGTSGYTSWSGSNNMAFGNTTDYTPALPSNWSTPTASVVADPQLGTCIAWTPDGSAAKLAGRGANVLYRYVDGVITTTPLWNTTTGEFPHGALVTGLSDVAGKSLFDLHTRLRINTGGCSFPAGYGGGGGSTTVVKGTTAASGLSTTATPLTWNHTIAASQDRLLVCIGLRDIAGSVGSVSGVDVSGQAMTLVRRETTTPAHRAAELWSLAAPTSGARTITATLTGAISGALGRSIEFDATSGLNTAVGVSANTGSTLSVTAPTNTNELVVDCTVSSNSSTYTHGTDQTGETDLSHASVSLLLAMSTQNGVNGGAMSNSTGTSVYQAKAAVSLIAGTPDPPSTATLTQSEYLFIYPTGTEAGAPPILSWLSDSNAKNLPISSRPNGYARVRAMITGGVATTSPFGVALFCRKNAESYTKAVDTFGSTIFRLYGPGVTPDVPSSLTATSNRLCGSSCVTGALIRDQASTFTVPPLTVGQKIELDSVVVFQAAAGNTANCRYQKDDGTVFDAYTNTPLITFTENSAGAP